MAYLNGYLKANEPIRLYVSFCRKHSHKKRDKRTDKQCLTVTCMCDV